MALFEKSIVRDKHGNRVLLPSHQAHHEDVQDSYVQQINPISVVGTTILTTANVVTPVDFYLTKQRRHINGVTLRVKLTETGGSSNVIMQPTPWWIDRVEIMTSNSRVIQTIRPYLIEMALAAKYSKEKFSAFCDKLGYDAEFCHDRDASKVPAGASRYFYLPLSGSIFDVSEDGIPMDRVSPHLVVRFYFNGAVFETGGTLSCDQMVLMLDGQKHDAADREKFSNEARGLAVGVVYLDATTQESKVNTSVCASKFSMALPSIRGDCAADLFYLASGSPTPLAGVNNRASSIGLRDATLSMETIEGRKLLGDADIDVSYLKMKAAKQFQNPTYLNQRNVYPILYTSSIGAAFSGSKQKGLLQHSRNEQLSIIPSGTAPTAPVWTFTLSATAVTGSYSMAFTNPITGLTDITEDLAYDTTAANIKIAIEKLKSWPRGAAVTVSGALSQTRTATVSLLGSALEDKAELLSVRSLQMIMSGMHATSEVNCNVIQTLSTPGVSGHTAASYNYVVLPLLYRQANFNEDGDVTVVLHD